MLKFGDTLRAAREGQKYSLAALGKRLGCDLTYIHAMEKGRRLPSDRAYVERIAEACAINPKELLDAYAHDRLLICVGRIESDLTPELSSRIKTFIQTEAQPLLAA